MTDFDHIIELHGTKTPKVKFENGEHRVEAGSVGPIGKVSETKRLSNGRLVPRRFSIQILLDNTALAAFCHEMIHIKQWAFDELGVALRDGKLQELFYDVPISNCAVNYEDLPWEIEAHRDMYPLAEWVKARI